MLKALFIMGVILGSDALTPAEKQQILSDQARTQFNAYVQQLDEIKSRKDRVTIFQGQPTDVHDCGAADFMVEFYNGRFFFPSASTGTTLNFAGNTDETFNIVPASKQCIIHVKLTVEALNK